MAKRPNKKTSLLNSRFINVVDIILKMNKAGGYEPDTERALSKVIAGDPTAINKIRRGERSPTPQQIYRLGEMFNLDFNVFFRNQPVRYGVYNYKMPRKEKIGDFALRMTDRFPLEIKRMEQVILSLSEVIKNLSREKGDPVTIKQAKKAFAEGKAKILEAFARI